MGDNRAKLLGSSAPELTADDLNKINALYTPHIFRQRKTGRVWCTRCGYRGILPTDHPVMMAIHKSERTYQRTEPRPEPVVCPQCGQTAYVKELGRTGRRDNLCERRRVVVLHWDGCALWGSAYYTIKRYDKDLTALPEYVIGTVYRFTLGVAERTTAYTDKSWGEHQTAVAPLSSKWKFKEPFLWNSDEGMSYAVINLEAVDESPMRYCGYGELLCHSLSPMRLLALCALYPRQVEMLGKAGMYDPIIDFESLQKKNVRAFCWEVQDPQKAFGLNGQELKAFLASSCSMDVLCAYKQFRRAGQPETFQRLEYFYSSLPYVWFARIMRQAINYKLHLSRLENYRLRQNLTVYQFANLWCDYIDAAETCGLNLWNDIFLLPEDLEKKHKKVTKTAAKIIKTKNDEHAKNKERERLKRLTKRYTYSDGQYLIRPPLGAAEIVAEGKTLRHCVGGYADRHVAGRCTILFLRDLKRPGRPLVTIEVYGAEIVQIHGWDDERSACSDNPKRESPRKIYRAFLDGWLAWLIAGSKRDKNGRPVLPDPVLEVAI